MTAGFLRRIGAYLIDIMIILFLSNLLSMVLPNNDKIANLTNEGNTLMNEYYEVLSSSSEEIEEYSIKLNDYSYKLGKLSVYSNLVTIVLYFLYFILFQSYNSGQTVGKRLLKIEIHDLNGNKLSFKQLFIRGIILYPILFNLLDIIAILVFKQAVYEDVSFVLALIKYLLFFACFISIIVSHRGIHDKIAGTYVVLAGSVSEDDEDKITKWKKVADKEKEVKKYRKNHTSGKRKECYK